MVWVKKKGLKERNSNFCDRRCSTPQRPHLRCTHPKPPCTNQGPQIPCQAVFPTGQGTLVAHAEQPRRWRFVNSLTKFPTETATTGELEMMNMVCLAGGSRETELVRQEVFVEQYSAEASWTTEVLQRLRPMDLVVLRNLIVVGRLGAHAPQWRLADLLENASRQAAA
mmetsp:Transcript_61044/g.70932  ORF Transcript_61044/g.70932 Transcript_61044/m.70932 type:complete len:168 (+) Transcript_61044:2-505(+)